MQDAGNGATRVMSGLLRPGARLAQRLTLTQRLVLTAASLLLPLLVLMGVTTKMVLDHRDFAIGELQGLDVHEALMPVVTTTQALREAAQRVTSGEAEQEPAFEAQRAALADQIATLEQVLMADGPDAFDPVWRPLADRLQQLRRLHAVDVPDAATALVEELRRLAAFNGEVSKLLLDPVAESYFLMELTLKHSIAMLEATSASEQLGARLLMVEFGSRPERLRVLDSAWQLRRGVVAMQHDIEAHARAGGTTPGSWAGAMEAAEVYAAHLSRAFAGDILDGDATQHRMLADELTQGLLAVHGDSVHRLRAVLQERIDSATQRLALLMGLFVLALAALAYIVTVSMITVRGALNHLLKGADAVADGDLTRTHAVLGRDEVARIGHAQDRMAERLSSLVSNIRSDAAQVSMAGTLLADGSTQLSSRTQQQGECLASASQAVLAISHALSTHAEEARALDTLSTRLQAQSQHAGAAMTETVQAMQAAQESAERVGAIIGVLDDLAFQTGMLALNASIEAAKAGAAGQRFSIVASEVRQLAQRSAEASEQIRTLVNSSADQVRLAAGHIATASDGTRDVSEGIEQVSQRLAGLAQASQAHSSELTGVTAMIGNLDDITRDNARLVEQTATASAELLQRAQTLGRSVASVRLRQGSADEARALVERALAHWQRVGREQALHDFHDPEAGFIDRDLYIVVFNRMGVYSAVGLNPEMVGRSMSEQPGMDARQALALSCAAADAGGEWIRHTIINPHNGELQLKESWVVACGEDEILLCGVFRENDSSTKPRVAASWAGSASVMAAAPARQPAMAASDSREAQVATAE